MKDTDEKPDNDNDNGDGTAWGLTTKHLELVAAWTLAVAGIVAAWSTYQAARWGGEQSIQFGRASALRVESTREAAAADALRAADLSMFSSWIEAYATGETELQDFFEERFRPGFRVAFEEWVASEPARSPDAAPSPFSLPSYEFFEYTEAEALVDSAELRFSAGEDANRQSDLYVLNSALLAAVLFLAGVAQQFRRVRPQAIILTVAVILLARGIYNVVVYPTI